MRSKEEIEQGMEINLAVLKQALNDLRAQLAWIDGALSDGEYRGIQIMPAARAIQEAVFNLEILHREVDAFENKMVDNDKITVEMKTDVTDIKDLD